MKNGFLASLAGLVLGAGVVLGQEKPSLIEKLPTFPKKLLEKPDKTADKQPGSDEPRNSLFRNMDTLQPGPGDGPDILRGSDAGFWTPHGQLWASSEFLLTWTKETRPLQPLVSGLVFVPSTGEDDPGGEQVVTLAGGPLDFNTMAGLRLSGGYWFDPERCEGVEGSLLFLGKRSLGGNILDAERLLRPYINFNTREPADIVIASPGIAAGTISATATTRAWGMEANLLKNLYYEPVFKCVRVDLLCGLRYMDLADNLRVERATSFNADLTANPQFLAFQSNRIFEKESIRTHNSFYGAQAGVGLKIFGDYCVFDIRGKVAMGVNCERLTYAGEQLRIRANGVRSTSPGALLALPSNLGTHRREQFNYLPEITANVGIPIGNHFGFYVGYTFLYWSSVSRATDQVDRVVDASQIPNLPPPIPGSSGIGRPGAPFLQTHWWAQGINLGLEFHW